MNVKQRLIIGAATCAGIGNAAKAPGTWGTIPGVALFVGLSMFPPALMWLFLGLFFLATIWVAHQAERLIGMRDPGQIVIDEVNGVLFALAGLPVSAGVCVAGFLLFRLFDIVKPFPIGYLERRCSGGFGIALDDALAGAAANLVLRALLALGWIPFV
jgi:phosphatidylglycerophosphatase A